MLVGCRVPARVSAAVFQVHPVWVLEGCQMCAAMGAVELAAESACGSLVISEWWVDWAA